MRALPLSAAMSVRLRRSETGFLKQRRQHDRRSGVHLRIRAAQVAQDRLDALEVRRHDLEDVAVVARDVVALEYTGMLFHLALGGHLEGLRTHCQTIRRSSTVF